MNDKEPVVIAYNYTAAALAPLSNEKIAQAIAKFSATEQRQIIESVIAIRKRHLKQACTHTDNVVLALRKNLITEKAK